MRPFDRVDAHIAPATTNHAVTTVYANLSNAEGALEYFGGAVIAGGFGLLSLSWAAGALTVVGLVLTAASHWLARRTGPSTTHHTSSTGLCMSAE